MSDPNTALMDYGYAFALSGAIGQAIGFTVAAASRKAPSWADRALFYAVTGALTINAFSAIFVHDYARAALCAFAMALAGASYGAVMARAPRAYAPGAPVSSARGARRTRRPRPYH